MKFDFDKCRSLMLDATLSELVVNESTIAQVPGFEAGGHGFRRNVSAISLCIAPWDRSFELALRDEDEKRDKSICYCEGDWKLYPLGGLEPPSNPQKTAVEDYFNSVYCSIENAEAAREIAHLMFLAAAEALLDHSVTTLLQKYHIDAPYVDDGFYFSRCFEYIVTDPDKSIDANYCEVVLANRITQRLKIDLER